MGTQGTFTVMNSCSSPITGHVSHKNNADEAIYFNDLAVGESSHKGTWISGAGTHDSWYWVISIGGAAELTGSFGCALYAKDEGQNTVITITDGEIEVTPPVSSSCGPRSLS